MTELLVVVPTRGQHAHTHRLMVDIATERDVVDTLIIDSQGDYTTLGAEDVVRTPDPLSWLQAANYGLTHGFSHHYDIVVVLNNDTRLSRGFFRGLLSAMTDGVGLCGPVYDDVWRLQRVPFVGPAADYVAQLEERVVPFIDGTCLGVSRRAFERTGGLNEQKFGRYGWAADFDYSIRVRRAGMSVVVTLRSYLNHVGQVTAHALAPSYSGLAVQEAAAGMTALYGADWPAVLGVPELVSRVYRRAALGQDRPRWGGALDDREF